VLVRFALLSLAALIAWETYLRVVSPVRENKLVVVSLTGATQHTIPDPYLGYRPAAKTKATIRTETPEGRKITEATYTTDGFHRRISIPNSRKATDKAVVFFGCSYTFGSGVNDDETMPSAYSKLHPNVQVYNYGYTGYGPQQTLALLEHKAPSKVEIVETNVDAVYTFMDDHVKRAIGSLGSVASRKGDYPFPYYDLQIDGTLVFHPNILGRDYFRGWVFPVILFSRVLTEALGDIPNDLEREHFELTARILNRAADLFHQRFRTGDFYVLFYPGSTLAPEISRYLEKGAIRVLDYSGTPAFKQPKFRIPLDNHPTPIAHRTLATRLP
jgi:hypothetical protein